VWFQFGDFSIFYGVVFSVLGIPNWLLYACLLDVWTLCYHMKELLTDVCNGKVIRCLWCGNCIPKQHFDEPRVSKVQGFNPMFAMYNLGLSRCRDFMFQCFTQRKNISASGYLILYAVGTCLQLGRRPMQGALSHFWEVWFVFTVFRKEFKTLNILYLKLS
jgi:hypothetical protein